MNVLIWLLTVLFGLIIIILLLAIRLSVKLQLRVASQQVKILITLRFFFSMLPIRILLTVDKNRVTSIPELNLVKSDGSKKAILTFKGALRNRKRKQSRLAKAFDLSIWKGIEMKRIMVSGRLGIDQNAFATCMIAGGTMLFFQNTIGALVNKRYQKNCGVFISPEFNRSILRVNLESILIVKPEQIIYAALKLYYRQNKKKGENNVTSN